MCCKILNYNTTFAKKNTIFQKYCRSKIVHNPKKRQDKHRPWRPWKEMVFLKILRQNQDGGSGGNPNELQHNSKRLRIKKIGGTLRLCLLLTQFFLDIILTSVAGQWPYLVWCSFYHWCQCCPSKEAISEIAQAKKNTDSLASLVIFLRLHFRKFSNFVVWSISF